MRMRKATTLTVLVLLLRGAATVSAQTPPDINSIMSRGYVDATSGFQLGGGGWDRLDSFSNTSTEWTITIDSISLLMLNPEEVSFSDMSTDNASDVISAASALYPGWFFWGANWWDYYTSLQNGQTPFKNWDHYRFGDSSFWGTPQQEFPIALGPNSTFTLNTIVQHTDTQLHAPPWQSDIGEVIVAWRFEGVAAHLPEPATLLVMGLGGLGLLRRACAPNRARYGES